MTRLRDIAELLRAPAALSVPGDIVVGAAGGGLSNRTTGLCAAAICLYGAGMAANDWADRDQDARERPERPIPSGRVTAGTALRTALGLSAGGLALAGLAGGRRALAVAVPLAAMVWCYDLKLKDTPAGPAAMAACRGLDVLLGASGHPGQWRRAMAPLLTVAAHTYLVTVLSRREVTGGDRITLSATHAGTVGIAVVTAVPAGTAPGSARRTALIPPGLVAWYTASYGIPQVRALAAPDAANTRTAVAAGITGLPALQGALAARSAGPRVGVAVAACAPLGQVLARWLSPT
jgi:4-hydroxybenzoate polyprenyltransferase